ncbi:MAG: dienelactone hydrolase family protein [Dehalobacterium sp.]
MVGKESAVIVLHEIYGINPHIRYVCQQYEAVGYDIICPNFIKSGFLLKRWTINAVI